MKSLILGGTVLILGTASHAHPIQITAERVGPRGWNYEVNYPMPGIPTQSPMFFSLPVHGGFELVESSLQCPPKWGIYGVRGRQGRLDSIAFGVGEHAQLSDLIIAGTSKSGFIFETTLPTVAISAPVPYGIGNSLTGELSVQSHIVAPVPSLGTTQTTANVQLMQFLGANGGYRLGRVQYSRPGYLKSEYPAVGADAQLLCPGPDVAGTYEVTLEFFGYLRKQLSVQVINNVCSFSAILIPGDIDGSNEIDAADIDAIIGNFGNLGGVCDLDGSEEVDAADIDIVISNFGQTGD